MPGVFFLDFNQEKTKKGIGLTAQSKPDNGLGPCGKPDLSTLFGSVPHSASEIRHSMFLSMVGAVYPDVGPYSVENVAERDLLRTEGDPAAVGYTINEAVALTRSMVSLLPLY
ncbi:hypothetical protein BHE74_00017921 [Ensete ventricosum]|nr:hypothetical protein BHE74_00017921 [Ensete ventricosum]RZR96971.1 hypothetical protein BHM03_00026068 [Ensete ventricosum]